MANVWSHLMMFIGTYLGIFFILEIIPIEFDFILVMGLGAIGMLLVLVYLTRRKDFDNHKFYKANFIFVVLFCGITIVYNKTLELNDAPYFWKDKFYLFTLTTNHAILIGTLLILAHMVLKRQWKSSLIVGSTMLAVAVYLWVVV